MAQLKKQQSFQYLVVRVARVHFFFLAVYALYIAVSDAWNLITPQGVLQRWTAAAAMLIVTTALWYTAKNFSNKEGFNKLLLLLFIVQDILFASFSVYTTRGMASRAVMLFMLPLVTAAFLRTRTALFATAAISTACYVLAAVKYYVTFPGEGYRAELYVEVAFYSAVMFVVASLLAALVRSSD